MDFNNNVIDHERVVNNRPKKVQFNVPKKPKTEEHFVFHVEPPKRNYEKKKDSDSDESYHETSYRDNSANYFAEKRNKKIQADQAMVDGLSMIFGALSSSGDNKKYKKPEQTSNCDYSRKKKNYESSDSPIQRITKGISADDFRKKFMFNEDVITKSKLRADKISDEQKRQMREYEDQSKLTQAEYITEDIPNTIPRKYSNEHKINEEKLIEDMEKLKTEVPIEREDLVTNPLKKVDTVSQPTNDYSIKYDSAYQTEPTTSSAPSRVSPERKLKKIIKGFFEMRKKKPNRDTDIIKDTFVTLSQGVQTNPSLERQQTRSSNENNNTARNIPKSRHNIEFEWFEHTNENEIDDRSYLTDGNISCFLELILAQENTNVAVMRPAIFSHVMEDAANIRSSALHYAEGETRTLLIPVFQNGNHWTLYHYDHDTRTLAHLDSFNFRYSNYTEHDATVKYFIKELFNEEITKINRIKNAPFFQTDGYNCGVYACIYAEAIIRNIKLNSIAKDCDIQTSRALIKSTLEDTVKNDSIVPSYKVTCLPQKNETFSNKHKSCDQNGEPSSKRKKNLNVETNEVKESFKTLTQIAINPSLERQQSRSSNENNNTARNIPKSRHNIEFEWFEYTNETEIDDRSYFTDGNISCFLELILAQDNTNVAVMRPAIISHVIDDTADIRSSALHYVEEETRTLLIPVFQNGNHWTLYHYDHDTRTLAHLDSFNFRYSNYTEHDATVKYFIKELFNEEITKINRIKNAPFFQTDGINCGVYACIYAEAIIRNINLNSIAKDFDIQTSRALIKSTLEDTVKNDCIVPSYKVTCLPQKTKSFSSSNLRKDKNEPSSKYSKSTLGVKCPTTTNSSKTSVKAKSNNTNKNCEDERTKIVLPVRNNREPSSKYIKISNQDNEIKVSSDDRFSLSPKSQKRAKAAERQRRRRSHLTEEQQNEIRKKNAQQKTQTRAAKKNAGESISQQQIMLEKQRKQKHYISNRSTILQIRKNHYRNNRHTLLIKRKNKYDCDKRKISLIRRKYYVSNKPRILNKSRSTSKNYYKKNRTKLLVKNKENKKERSNIKKALESIYFLMKTENSYLPDYNLFEISKQEMEEMHELIKNCSDKKCQKLRRMYQNKLNKILDYVIDVVQNKTDCERKLNLLVLLYKTRQIYKKHTINQILELIRQIEFTRLKARENVLAAVNKIKIHVNADVFRPSTITDIEHKTRVLCRYNFHLSNGTKDLPFKPISKVFQSIYDKFMHKTPCEKKSVIDEVKNLSINIDENISKINEDMSFEIKFKVINSEEENDRYGGIFVDEWDDENLYNYENMDVKDNITSEKENNENKENNEALDDVIETMIPSKNSIKDNSLLLPYMKQTTFVRECDSNCEKISENFTTWMFENMEKLSTSVNIVEIQEIINNFDNNIVMQEMFMEYRKCHSGLRSLFRRLQEIRRDLKVVERIDKIVEEKDVSGMIDVARFSGLSKQLQEQVYAAFQVIDDRRTQQEIMKSYGNILKKFEQEITIMESEPCHCCTRLFRPADLSSKEGQKIQQFIAPDFKNMKINQICRECAGPIKQNKMPFQCYNNQFAYDDIPPELQNLNWIEMLLIQKIRPVQQIIQLKTVDGRYTSMSGKAGGVVFLPVPITETMDHLVEVLPSASNLKIHIESSVDSKIVDLPKVLTALKWLKSNNKFYEDIRIDPAFQFEDDQVYFDKPSTYETRYNLISRGRNDGHLITQIDLEPQPLIATDPQAPAETAFDLYALNKINAKPIEISSKHLDVLSFPQFFPTGFYGFSDHRQESKKNTLRNWIRTRLRQSNRRVAQSAQMLCMTTGILEQLDIINSLNIQTRMSKDKLNNTDILSRVNNKDPDMQYNMSTFFTKLRGYPGYWKGVKTDLEAHIQTFGTPTWFLTLNPNERNWTELIEYYDSIFKNEKVTSKNISEYISKDPSLFSRYFQRRLSLIMDEIVLNAKGPLGKVTHFFYRLEYQKRGTPHAHCLLWCKDAPGPDSSEEDIIKYIDSHVTARLPDPTKEPELYDLVTQCQTHYKGHSKTCKRGKGKKEYCRFEYPRPECGRTFLNDDVDSALRRLPGVKKKLYYLRRNKDETYINDYNEAILMANKGNIDIQYIHSKTPNSKLVNYVTGYTTKSEVAIDSVMVKINNAMMTRAEAFTTSLDLLKKRQIGLLELCDILAGHKMYQFDTDHLFLNTNAEDKRMRMMKPLKAIQDNPDEEESFIANAVDTYYPNRPDELKDYSLYNIMSNFKIVPLTKKGKQPNIDSDEEDDETYGKSKSKAEIVNPFNNHYHIKNSKSPFYCHPHESKKKIFAINNTKKGFKKCKPRVLRLFWPHLESFNETSREDYFRRLLMVFKPYKNEAELMETSGSKHFSYEESWNSYMDELKSKSKTAYEDVQKFINNHSQFVKLKIEAYQQFLEQKKLLKELDIDDNDDQVAIEICERTVNKDEHMNDVMNLNKIQREIFNDITETIANQEKNLPAQQVLRFVSGTAGTGKSYLINALADHLTLNYADATTMSTNPAVLLCAPTALAAVQIKGSTCHALFGLRVQHGKEKEMEPLSPQKLNQLRNLFKNVKLVILDEGSMLSSKNLHDIHKRLVEIKGTAHNVPFGGVNLIILGDLLQLPPVKASKVFKPINDTHSLLQGYTIWSLLRYNELLENMRQKDDLMFSEILNKIRIGIKDADDIKILKKRIIFNGHGTLDQLADFYVKKMKEDGKMMALFPTVAKVNEFNLAVAKAFKLNVTEIMAHDSGLKEKLKNNIGNRPYRSKKYCISGKIQKTRTSKYNKTKDNAARTAGLERNLMLAEGARVMLRRNINASMGLVNGAIGTLIKIHSINNEPTTLEIKFDQINDPQQIQKVSAVFDVGVGRQCTRRQFPVSMSYAATIHKSQGMTLNNVMLSTESIFSPGQLFVALSRVKNLNGLYLCDFEEDKIMVDKESVIEYNRLRATVPGLNPLPVINTVKESKKHDRITVQPDKKINVTFEKEKIIVTVEKEKDEKYAKGRQLRNKTGSDCFIISAINLLYSCEAINDAIIQYNGNDQCMAQLKEIMMDKKFDTNGLRSTFPEKFRFNQNNTRLQNYGNTGLLLTEFMLQHLKKMQLHNSYEINIKKSPQNCSCRINLQRNYSDVALNVDFEKMVFENTKAISVGQAIDDFLHLRKTCTTCGQIEGYDMLCEFNEYAFVILGSRKRPKMFYRNTNCRFGNARWNIVSMSYFKKEHYKTWVNNGNTWNVIDDDDIKIKKKLKAHFKNYTVILFKKV